MFRRRLREPERFIPILKDIREVLLKYGHIGHADQISELIDLANLRSSEFAPRFLHGGVWAGSGSIADVVFRGNVKDMSEDQLEMDDLLYVKLLIRLADEMWRQRVRDPGIRNWATMARSMLPQRD